MPIKELWYRYKIECLEVFLSRAFNVQDKYTLAFTEPETDDEEELDQYPDQYPKTLAEVDHAGDILLGYQDIVFRAVYSELNALVELELKNLARSILEAGGEKRPKLNRGTAGPIIEKKHGIDFEDLPGFDGVDEVRNVTNAYKHDDGFTSTYEEDSPGGGWLFGYYATRYKLDWDKAFESIQAVKEFMRALPGERQEFPEHRRKQEDEATIQARQLDWEYLRKCGALGHRVGKPTKATDEKGGYTATCELCGKSFWAEHEEWVHFTSVMDRDNCPGIPELHKQRATQQNITDESQSSNEVRG